MKFDDPVVTGLVEAIRAQYALDWNGIHGISHWARVWENGMRIAKETGANTKVVGYFALFHDARRCNDGVDPEHGKRGAELATQWRGQLLELSDEDFVDYVRVGRGTGAIGPTHRHLNLCPW